MIFDDREDLGDKKDKLIVVMKRLVIKETKDKKPFKSQIYKGRCPYSQGQSRSYNHRNHQNRDRSDSGNRGHVGRGNRRQRFQQDSRRNVFRKSQRGYTIQNNRGDYYNRYGNRSRERQFFRDYSLSRDRSLSSNGRSRSGNRANMNRDRIQCYNCREYDHFVRDCPTLGENRDLDQLQQMLNMEDGDQTHLLTSKQQSYKNGRPNPLNL